MKEYAVEIFKENILGSVLLGGSYVKAEKFENFLNDKAKEGWKFRDFHRETRRILLFFSREALIVIFESDN